MAKKTKAELKVILDATIYDNNNEEIQADLHNAYLTDAIDSGMNEQVPAADAPLNMRSHKIVAVTDPTNDQEAATKKYVDDNVSSGGVELNNWHVNKNGLDTNKGNRQSPFLTIPQAISVFSTGDIIHIGGGNFSDNFTVANTKLILRGVTGLIGSSDLTVISGEITPDATSGNVILTLQDIHYSRAAFDWVKTGANQFRVYSERSTINVRQLTVQELKAYGGLGTSNDGITIGANGLDAVNLQLKNITLNDSGGTTVTGNGNYLTDALIEGDITFTGSGNFLEGGTVLKGSITGTVTDNRGTTPYKELYVNNGYPGGDSDGTQQRPFTDVQDAIDIAETSSRYVIYSGAGIYTADLVVGASKHLSFVGINTGGGGTTNTHLKSIEIGTGSVVSLKDLVITNGISTGVVPTGNIIIDNVWSDILIGSLFADIFINRLVGDVDFQCSDIEINNSKISGQIQSSGYQIISGGTESTADHEVITTGRIEIHNSSCSGDITTLGALGTLTIKNSVASGTLSVSQPPIVYGNQAGRFHELSADPSDPPEGNSIMWQSDGTGSGDDGDILMKITAGAVTKTATLIDFSAI